jgi:hypothetical protein
MLRVTMLLCLISGIHQQQSPIHGLGQCLEFHKVSSRLKGDRILSRDIQQPQVCLAVRELSQGILMELERRRRHQGDNSGVDTSGRSTPAAIMQYFRCSDSTTTIPHTLSSTPVSNLVRSAKVGHHSSIRRPPFVMY